MPVYRPRRRSRLPILAWMIALMTSLTMLGSMSTGAVNAEEPGPPQCSGGDSTGELPPGSQEIVGTVTDGVGEVADLQVRLTSTAGGQEATLTTATGEYRFESLGEGTYFVSFFDWSATYASGFYVGAGPVVADKADATGVILDGGGATGIDATLMPETFSSISGVVTDVAAAPVGNALVTVRGAFFPLVACDETNGSGEYQIQSVRSGVYSAVAEKIGLPRARYASPVVVPPDAIDINFQFPEVHTLSGVVLTEGGDPVDTISVSACETTTNECGFASSAPETGAFDIPGLVAGSYVLHYQDSSGNGLYRTGYYGGEDVWVATKAESVAVAVPGDPVQLRAEPAPRVSGTITPLVPSPDTVLVSLCDANEDNCFAAYAGDADGAYSIGVPVPGTYVARVFDYSGTYPSGGWIAADGSIVRDATSALQITVADTDVPSVDATLPDGGRIEVSLTSDGQPAPYAAVQFCLEESVCPDGLSSNDLGYGLSPAMFTDTYYVQVSLDYQSWYWYVSGGPVSSSFGAATPIAVSANSFDSIFVDLPVPGSPTDAGTQVEPVTVPLDDGTGNTPVTLTFADVTVSGTSSLTVSETGDPAPEGFQLGVPATYYDITTTAEFAAPITVCISYAGVSYADESGLRFYHYDATNGWEDITVPPVDTVNQIICGSTDSLSPFVIVERTYNFGGFFGPKAPPHINDAKAGDTIGVQFSLGGDLGLSIFGGNTPTVRQFNCSTGVYAGTAQDGTGTLKYNAKKGVYTYGWKTLKTWKNTCRELTLTFGDGSTAAVWYRLKS